MVNFVLRHSGLERGWMSKDILPFPLSTSPTEAEISLSLEAGKAQLGQAEGEEATVDECLQEAGLEAWRFLVTRVLNFVMNALFPAPGASERCQLAGHRSARGCSGKTVVFPLSRSLTLSINRQTSQCDKSWDVPSAAAPLTLDSLVT